MPYPVTRERMSYGQHLSTYRTLLAVEWIQQASVRVPCARTRRVQSTFTRQGQRAACLVLCAESVMQYFIIWFHDSEQRISSHYGAFGPFATHAEASKFATERDQHYPQGALYKIITLHDPKYARKAVTP